MIERARSLYARHAKWVPIVFFLLGFLFDAVMLRRIDDLFVILQQAAYIAVSGTLICLEALEHCGKYSAGQGLWSKAWRYREAVVHFLLGTLLNAYTIFYFKSASVLTSFCFVGFLVVVLMVNEFKKFKDSQIVVHMALWALCLISYSVYLVPTLMGFIGDIPFVVSMICSLALSGFIYLRLRKAAGESSRLIDRRVMVPFVLVHVLFVGLYFARAIPPVPLSVSFIGIYHGVKKESGKYQLTYHDLSWKFWRNSDVEFAARPEDRLFCFAAVFSPARFEDRLMVRWLYRDAHRNWQRSDAIPLQIAGGREEGFRGYTVKSNYSPGDWRCQIETSDGREIGRTTFHVSRDESTGPRASRVHEQ